jgi:hypothetical protein
MKLIKKLITYNRKYKWQVKAQEFIDVLKDHHCSIFFKDPIPEDFKEYFEKIKEPRDLTLIEIKLSHKEYNNLKEFIKDVSLIWDNSKSFYNNKNSFIYKQGDTMENFMTHLIKEEGIFDMFDNPEDNKNNAKDESEEDDLAVVIN